MTHDQYELFNSLRKDREENARVLEKTSMKGVKRSLTEKYSEQAHFIYELLQNADDVKATKVRFVLNNDGLIFAHNGTIHFSISDPAIEKEDMESGKLGHINSITSIGSTTKFESQIGKFGVGFKSVFLYTNTPHVYDPPFMFKIERFIVPILLERDHPARIDDETLFYFKFDLNNAEKKPDIVYKEIDKKLQNLDNPLLFLRHLEKIEWNNTEGNFGAYLKQVESNNNYGIVSLINKVNDKSSKNKFLIFEEKIHADYEHKINVAFQFVPNENKISSDCKFPAYCFFSTREYTGLKFIVNAPFLLTDSREGIQQGVEKHGIDWNKLLIDKIAALFVNHLTDMKDIGLLNLDFFNVLPISEEDFQYGLFKPIYDAVLNKLKSDEKLLPANKVGYISSKQALLGRSKELIDLLESEQLSPLFEKMNAQWLDSNITQDKSPELKKYLIEKLDIPEITPEKFANKFTKEFIDKQTDDWVIEFYIFLKAQKSLWREHTYLSQGPLRYKPFIRLENNIHVAPFDGSGKPLAYLPGNSGSSFPTVKRTIVNVKQAKEFLIEVGLTEPDKIAEVIEVILPKYTKIENITIEENVTDVKKIIGALKAAPDDKKDYLISKLQNITFLIGVNTNTQMKYFCSPRNLYITKPYIENNDLDDFFHMNPNVYFIYDAYDITKELLLKMGCSDKIRVKYREYKYDSYGWHIRGLNGFDPECEIDGLEYALENRTIKRAQVIWNILKEYHQIIYGCVEKSSRQDYSGSSREEQASIAGKLLREKVWLPDKNGDFDKPSNLFLSDLHDGFDKDSTESKKIAEKLEFKKEILQKLDSYPQIPDDLKTKIAFAESLTDEEIRIIEDKRELDKADPEKDQEFNYTDELRKVFIRPQEKLPSDPTIPPGPIPDPNYRKERTQKEIRDSIENEPVTTERFKRVPAKKWEQKNNEIRTFLQGQYLGKCQICGHVFTKRSGEPYFEGLYLFSRTKAAWIDRYGNVLCLCANCCAKFQHGSVEADDIVLQINNPKKSNEEGLETSIIKFKLCGEDAEIKFTPRHILDLQEILKANVDE